MRRAKVVCTLGSAADSPEQVQALVSVGTNVAHTNYSHDRAKDQEEVIGRIREAAAASGRAVAIFVDLQGLKIRLGRFMNNQKIMLNKGNEFIITINDVLGTVKRASTIFKGLSGGCHLGDRLPIDDGNVAARVMAVTDIDVVTKAEALGYVSDDKGINLPGVAVPVLALSEKDREDLRWALEIGADLITLSFVRDADDIKDIHEIIDEVGVRIPIVARVERPQAVENLFDIVSAFDGIMVVRGNLGVEMPLEAVSLMQKRAIELTRRQAKSVIVAIQVLEPMIQNPWPTRVEASDYVNAIPDGADIVVPSGETSAGAYPIETVRTMASIIENVEEHEGERIPGLGPYPQTRGGVLTCAAAEMGGRPNVTCLVTFTQSNDTARRLSHLRSPLPLLAFTPLYETCNQLAIFQGVQCYGVSEVQHTDEMVTQVDETLQDKYLAQSGDIVVVVAGIPPGTPGSANSIRVHTVGEAGNYKT